MEHGVEGCKVFWRDEQFPDELDDMCYGRVDEVGGCIKECGLFNVSKVAPTNLKCSACTVIMIRVEGPRVDL